MMSKFFTSLEIKKIVRPPYSKNKNEKFCLLDKSGFDNVKIV